MVLAAYRGILSLSDLYSPTSVPPLYVSAELHLSNLTPHISFHDDKLPDQCPKVISLAESTSISSEDFGTGTASRISRYSWGAFVIVMLVRR